MSLLPVGGQSVNRWRRSFWYSVKMPQSKDCMRDRAFRALSKHLPVQRIASLLYVEVAEDACTGDFVEAKHSVRGDKQMVALSEAAISALEDYLNAPEQGVPGRDYHPVPQFLHRNCASPEPKQWPVPVSQCTHQ